MSVTTKTAYLTIDDANRYFAGRLDTDYWDQSSPSDQQKSLIQATSDIDRLAYNGVKAVPSQEHEYPRLYNDQQFDMWVYDTDFVPMDIKYGVCEQALALLGGFDSQKEIDNLSVSRKSYASVKVEYDRSSIPMHLKAGLCANAWRYVIVFIRDQRNVLLTRV